MHIKIEITVHENQHSWPALATQTLDFISSDVIALTTAANSCGATMERLILGALTIARNELAKGTNDATTH
jgi:hypothetical protein